MAKTQFNVEQFKTEAVKPLYAVAGATEIAVELARGYATEAQKATQERFSGVQTRVSRRPGARRPRSTSSPKTLPGPGPRPCRGAAAEAKRRPGALRGPR